MTDVSILEKYGLFSARVPRYTSYPPANHFLQDVGNRYQKDWLGGIHPGEEISLYVHIPFCRRLCWFCACRTQGTSTLRPVDAYIETLLSELNRLREHVAKDVNLVRLHLGGGTPTILSPKTMDRLLDGIYTAFPASLSHEFSVEIDPTEAADALLDGLIARGMQRASIGVQDFAPKVQKAIGRDQSFEQTERVIDRLRGAGLKSLNLDLLYGLPFQTAETLDATLDKVIALKPDRLALYGYAHVPWMSKRQVMIDGNTLPDPHTRYDLAELAREKLTGQGYRMLGIDHFALPDDSLAVAADKGEMRRNFQGYTDDPAETLVGVGASAISRFREGYVQNAVSTSAYSERVHRDGLAAHKGIALKPQDNLLARLIELLMCSGAVDFADLEREFPGTAAQVQDIAGELSWAFKDAIDTDAQRLTIKPGYQSLARIIAAHIDAHERAGQSHSIAV